MVIQVSNRQEIIAGLRRAVLRRVYEELEMAQKDGDRQALAKLRQIEGKAKRAKMIGILVNCLHSLGLSISDTMALIFELFLEKVEEEEFTEIPEIWNI